MHRVNNYISEVVWSNWNKIILEKVFIFKAGHINQLSSTSLQRGSLLLALSPKYTHMLSGISPKRRQLLSWNSCISKFFTKFQHEMHWTHGKGKINLCQIGPFNPKHGVTHESIQWCLHFTDQLFGLLTKPVKALQITNLFACSITKNLQYFLVSKCHRYNAKPVRLLK